MRDAQAHGSGLTFHVPRLRAFNQFDIGPRDDGCAAISKTDFHHTHVALGWNLLEIGRQTCDFTDLAEQWVSNDANLVADPDAFPLRNSGRAVGTRCACMLGNDNVGTTDGATDSRGA